jgi:hypothetical protein
MKLVKTLAIVAALATGTASYAQNTNPPMFGTLTAEEAIAAGFVFVIGVGWILGSGGSTATSTPGT